MMERFIIDGCLVAAPHIQGLQIRQILEGFASDGCLITTNHVQ